MDQSHSHLHDDHDHHHDHSHGNEHDRGLRAMLRYLSFAPRFWRSEVNNAVVARLAPARNETALDIGAGVGAGTVVAAKSGGRVIAVEPTPAMRRILGIRRQFQRARKRIRIVDGAAEATGVDAGSVDAAWAVNTMHHWTNVDAAIVELARVLKPGGRLLLCDENFDDPTHPEHEEFTDRHDDDHSHKFTMVDPDELAEKFRAQGLDVTFAAFDQIIDRPAILIEATKRH